ncbi:MAG: TolC family protein [Gemmataceae bacterium]|nr:TolC family protein [Gemmataceae bacterium]
MGWMHNTGRSDDRAAPRIRDPIVPREENQPDLICRRCKTPMKKKGPWARSGTSTPVSPETFRENAMAAFFSSFSGLFRFKPRRTGDFLLSVFLLAGCQSATPSRLLPPASSMASIDPARPEHRKPAVFPDCQESSHKQMQPPTNAPKTSEDAIVQASTAAGPEATPTAPAAMELTVANHPSGDPALTVSHPTCSQLGTPGNGELSLLTLAQALNRSLLTNPDLVALRGRLDVNQAMVGVAQTYPWNPFVQTQFLPRGHPFVPNEPGLPASGAGQSNYYVWVMQRFELAHQRRFRTQGALAALDQVHWTIIQGELLNVSQTTRLYFAALYQKEINELARETAALNERLASIVERRFKANLAKAGDVTTAKVAARQSQYQAQLAETTYQAALLALHQQLNLPMTAPAELPERLGEVHWLPLHPEGEAVDEAMLAAELVEGRPDVLAAQSGVRVSDANFRLAHAAMVPDVQAGPIYDTSDAGVQFLGLRVQLNLPVFDTGAPLARQRRAEMNLQQLTLEQLKVRAALEAQAALNQYRRLRDLAAKVPPVRSGVMPPELKEIISQFEAGQADILAVLTTQNNLLQERRVYLDLLNQLAQSAAAVIQATGVPPDRVIHLAAGPCAIESDPEPNTLPQPKLLRNP